tara:strand:- start:4007 stop:4261 length:255 start_codon:yes stop_codon:yes gene_type:complete
MKIRRKEKRIIYMGANISIQNISEKVRNLGVIIKEKFIIMRQKFRRDRRAEIIYKELYKDVDEDMVNDFFKEQEMRKNTTKIYV